MSYVYMPRTRPASGKQRFPWFLFLFVGLALFVVFQWPLEIHTTADNYNESQELTFAGSGPEVRQAVLITLLVMATVSLCTRRRDTKLRFNGVLGWLLIAFLGWALLSAMWAQDLSLTGKRLTSFVIICVVAVAVVRRLSLRQIRMWTFGTMALYLVMAISAELIFGIFRPFAYGYRFSGLQHPNAEGVECALLALSGFVAAHMETRRRWLFVACGLIGTVFLVLTASRTTLAATTFAFAVYGVTVSKQTTRAMLLPLAGMLASVVMLVAATGAFQGLNAKLFPGRDVGGGVESFAGRTSVWEDLVPYIREHPLIGYGYGGFWTPAIRAVISDKEEWPVPDAHSTYVDYVLALGAVGLILNLLCLGGGLWRAFSFYGRTKDPHFAFLASVLIVCFMDGFLESSAGEVTFLSCISIITLIRLAFVPAEQTRKIAAEKRLVEETLCTA